MSLSTLCSKVEEGEEVAALKRPVFVPGSDELCRLKDLQACGTPLNQLGS